MKSVIQLIAMVIFAGILHLAVFLAADSKDSKPSDTKRAPALRLKLAEVDISVSYEISPNTLAVSVPKIDAKSLMADITMPQPSIEISNRNVELAEFYTPNIALDVTARKKLLVFNEGREFTLQKIAPNWDEALPEFNVNLKLPQENIGLTEIAPLAEPMFEIN